MTWTPYTADTYLDVDAIESFCRDLAADHPEWVELETVGETRHDHPIFLLTIAASETGPDGSERGRRPALWLDAGTHAAEWTGISAVLYVVSDWIERLTGGDEALQHWFRRHEALVMPCIAPDGVQAMRDGAPFVRSTLRPHEEGTVRSGFDPCDMDGDGRVRMMRWKHPAGSFVEDPEWAPFMRPRTLEDDPEDAYFLCDEGEFINWNGVEWTRASKEFGLDLNRNFPAHWNPFEMFGMDAGHYPLSEPESRAVVDTFADHPHVGCALTMHTYTGAILTQPYRADSPLGDRDIDVMERLAEEMAEETDYRTLKVHPEFMYDDDEPIVGVWADTISTVFGVPGYTVEFWDPLGYAGLEVDDPMDFIMDPDPETTRELLQTFAEDDGNVADWESHEHPQLGEVEIGGLEYLRTIRNPPVDELEDECEKALSMAERARQALPRTEASIEVESVGDNAQQLRIVLENMGFLPTSGLHRGEDLSITPEVAVRLEDDGKLEVDGPRDQELEHMFGWGDLRVGRGRHPVYADLSERGHRSFAEWTIRGEGSAEIEWIAGRGGRGTETVEIGAGESDDGE